MTTQSFTQEQTVAYLRKLGLNSAPEPSFETLSKLLALHQQSIPFENLDCMAQKPLSLKPDSLFEKLIAGIRGGISLELGTAFCYLLKSLGFEVQSYAANLINLDEQDKQPLHRITCVQLNGQKYICDAGLYTETARIPLLFETDTEQNDGVCKYRLKLNCGQYILEQKERFLWTGLYAFKEADTTEAEFQKALDFCVNDTHSPFNKANKISIHLPDSFAYITADMIKYRRNGQTIKQLAIEDRRQMNKLLAKVFHISFGEIKFVST